MERFRQDLAYGFRSLLRQPGFAIVATVTLALGIGANVAMVSFARAILFPSLPYEDPDRLVVLERRSERVDPTSGSFISFPALSDLKERNRVCAHFGMLAKTSRNLTGGNGEPERLDARLVSASLLETLGIEPHSGRGFSPDDDRLGAEPTVMLAYELWQRRFGGATEVLGSSLILDDQSYAVIGILPPGLSGNTLGHTTLGEVWLPLSLFLDDLKVKDRKVQREWVTLCRLKEGVRLAGARQDIARITSDLAKEYPSTDQDKKSAVIPIRERVVGDVREMTLALVAAVFFVLLIACTNLINLLLTRFVAREKEFAVRTALGGGRKRLVLQGLSEALALAMVGTLAGLILATFLIRALRPLLEDVPYAGQAGISPSELAYSALLCFVVTLAIGLIPSLQAISPSWQQLLTGSLGSRSFPAHRRIRQTLVVLEIALANVLLTGSVLALATFLNLRGQDLGFSAERVLSLQVSLPPSKYGEVGKWTEFFDQALARTKVLPGVEAAAVISALPMGHEELIGPVLAGDRPPPPRGQRLGASYIIASADAFRVMGIPLLEGRTFTPKDDDRLGAERVIVVSHLVAQHFWPDQSAIGQKLGFEFAGGTMEQPEVRWREIVGVVGDARYDDVSKAPGPAIYVSYTQRSSWENGSSPMALILKTRTDDPTNLVGPVRSELLEIDPQQPVHSVRTLQEIIEFELKHPRMVFVLLSLFAGLALVLAMVGIYGVVSYMVTARTREIGIRMALGAQPSQVLSRLLLRNLVLVLVGLGAGLVLAAALTHWMKSQLFGVTLIDPVILLGGAISLAVVAILATLVPTLQAARVEPASSLRYE